MKFYLVDDDKNIRKILKLIIEERNIGEVVGSYGNPEDAIEDLSVSSVDIVIVDLLMPNMDGIAFIKKAAEIDPSLAFVMISQVSSKDMISEAYENGIEFYIQKPINSIEVESVLKKVKDSLNLKRTVATVQNLFNNSLGSKDTTAPSEKTWLPKLKTVLQKLGIIGEIGSKDIITLIEYIIEKNRNIENVTLNELCSKFTDNPKSMEQRIRRAANTGMINLANLGIEEYSNDIFLEFSTNLYNFEQVRKEMDYIRGKSSKHGNVKIRNFLNSLVLYVQN